MPRRSLTSHVFAVQSYEIILNFKRNWKNIFDFQNIFIFFSLLSVIPHVDIGKKCTAKYDVLLRGAFHFRVDAHFFVLYLPDFDAMDMGNSSQAYAMLL